MIVILH